MPLETPKLLVVDESRDTIARLDTQSEVLRWSVDHAPDATTARSALERREYDLVLLVGYGDGHRSGLCRELKTIRSSAAVLYCSADVSERAGALRAGADDVIASPCSGVELLTRLQKMFELGQLRKAARQPEPEDDGERAGSEDDKSLGLKIRHLNHELNNPLCAISLDVQMLQLEISSSDVRTQEKLQRIETNVQRIQKLSEEMSRLPELEKTRIFLDDASPGRL